MTRLTLEWHLRTIRDGVAEGAYTTGFPTDGRVCDAFEVDAVEALSSGDPVQYLDAVAHDPWRPFLERSAAAELLTHHIWPDSPDAGPLGRSTSLCGHTDRPDIDFAAWRDAGMTRRHIGPVYLPMECETCGEGESLLDPDIARDEGRAVCMTCGTEQPDATYP